MEDNEFQQFVDHLRKQLNEQLTNFNWQQFCNTIKDNQAIKGDLNEYIHNQI